LELTAHLAQDGEVGFVNAIAMRASFDKKASLAQHLEVLGHRRSRQPDQQRQISGSAGTGAAGVDDGQPGWVAECSKPLD
jgi:hypothetical protein